MTGAIRILPGERGVVRVFAVDLPDDDARAFADDSAAVAAALGIGSLDPGQVDVFPVSRLAGLGLASYLAEGHGIPMDRLDATMLDAQTGWIAVIASRAFGEGGATLVIEPPLRLVGTYSEDTPPVRFDPLPSGGAEGILAGTPVAPPAPPVRGGGAGKLIALLVLAGLFIAMVFLGGRR